MLENISVNESPPNPPMKCEPAPIRILHAVNRMDRGGIETFLMRVYRELDIGQIQFDFLVHRSGNGAYDDEIRSRGGRIFHIDFRYSPFGFPVYRRNVLAFFDRHPEFQVAHAHLNAFNGLFLSLARAADVPMRIAHSHAQSPGNLLREPVWNLLKRLGRSSFSLKLSCSLEAGRWAYGRNAEFSIVRNGIPIEAFGYDPTARDRIRENYSLHDQTVVGHVGSFRPDKNQRFLLAVLECLRRCNTSACLFFIGGGKDQQAVANQAVRMGLQEHVVFAGEVAEPEKYYSAMDVLAFPSVDEGLGIVAIEAQAAGLPCVLSTGVPAEAAATDLAIRLPLNRNQNARAWATAIEDLVARPRDERPASPGLEAFDIGASTRRLQQMYAGTAARQGLS